MRTMDSRSSKRVQSQTKSGSSELKMKKKLSIELNVEFGNPANTDLVFATIEAETKALFEGIVSSASLVKQRIVMEGQEVSVLDLDLIDIKIVQITDLDTKTVW